LGRIKVFEAQYRTRQPLDSSVILLDDVVQVFALADFYACVMVSIKCFSDVSTKSGIDQSLTL